MTDPKGSIDGAKVDSFLQRAISIQIKILNTINFSKSPTHYNPFAYLRTARRTF